MRKSLEKYWPIVILTVLSILFFTKLFYPQSKIFVTPEFGMSDLWHFNLPYRFLLKEALSEGHLPLWTDKIGMGFPLFAEGQVAALSLVNLVPTLLFSAVTSFNISFVLIFLLLSISTFLFCKEIGISKTGALFSSIALTFSAKVVTQLNHPNILLTFAFLPLCLLLIEKYRKDKRAIWLLVLSFFLSQQILSGHLQMAFYCWIFLIIYWIFSLKSLKQPKRLIPLALAMVLAIGLSAVQLLPSWEFVGQSNRAVGVAEEIDAFPFRLKHLALFLRPNFFGTPADATYPLNAVQEGLFGESSVYIGIIPLVLGGLGVFWGFRERVKKGKKDEKGRQILFWGFVLVFSLLLSFGRATPLFFIFKLPLMNFFRIPPRLLFFSVFALIVLAGFGFDRLQEKLLTKFSISIRQLSDQFSIFSLFFLLFTLLDLFSFSYNYHPTVSTKDWIETPPATAEFLQKQQGEFRVVDAGSTPLWNNIFWHYGWQDVLPKYKNLRNSIFTNSNVYWDIKSAGVYSGVQVQGIKDLFDLLKKELAIAPDGALIITEKGAELLSLLNVRFFISPVNLVSDDFALSFHADPPPPAQEFAVFENKNFLPRIRFVETEIPIDAKITNTQFSNQKIEVSYDAQKQSRLLLADTFYPGWKAFVDGKETEIFPADLNSKFILAPKGSHKVEFGYKPKSFEIGKIISMISLLIWGGVLLKVKFKNQSVNIKAKFKVQN